eukprot:s2067_g8.t1
MWRIARQAYQLEDADPLADPPPATAAPQVAPSGSVQSPKKIKTSSVLDQLDESEVQQLTQAELDQAYPNHVGVTGSDPPEDAEPTADQIAALHAKVIVRGESPYADFSVLTPFGRRAQRQMKARAWTLQQDGTFRALDVPGKHMSVDRASSANIPDAAKAALDNVTSAASVAEAPSSHPPPGKGELWLEQGHCRDLFRLCGSPRPFRHLQGQVACSGCRLDAIRFSLQKFYKSQKKRRTWRGGSDQKRFPTRRLGSSACRRGERYPDQISCSVGYTLYAAEKFFSYENPEFSFAWVTRVMEKFIKHVGQSVHGLDQCPYGAETVKPTGLVTQAPWLKGVQFRCGQVRPHRHREGGLSGKIWDPLTETMVWRSSKAAEYPSGLCIAWALSLRKWLCSEEGHHWLGQRTLVKVGRFSNTLVRSDLVRGNILIQCLQHLMLSQRAHQSKPIYLDPQSASRAGECVRKARERLGIPENDRGSVDGADNTLGGRVQAGKSVSIARDEGWPYGGPLVWALGIHFVLREVELSTLNLHEDCIQLNASRREVTLALSTSKSDPEGRGCKRTLECSSKFGELHGLECPYCVAKNLVEIQVFRPCVKQSDAVARSVPLIGQVCGPFTVVDKAKLIDAARADAAKVKLLIAEADNICVNSDPMSGYSETWEHQQPEVVAQVNSDPMSGYSETWEHQQPEVVAQALTLDMNTTFISAADRFSLNQIFGQLSVNGDLYVDRVAEGIEIHEGQRLRLIMQCTMIGKGSDKGWVREILREHFPGRLYLERSDFIDFVNMYRRHRHAFMQKIFSEVDQDGSKSVSLEEIVVLLGRRGITILGEIG